MCDLSVKKFGDPDVKRYSSPLYDHAEPIFDERRADALISTKALMGMTEADMKCYTDRYTDVGTMNARDHYE